jgi:hypothetical protein
MTTMPTHAKATAPTVAPTAPAAMATTLSVMAGRVPAIRPPTDRAEMTGTHPAVTIEA